MKDLIETSRTEQQVFDELGSLCTSPGYIHALAHIGMRDNMIAYGGALTPETMAASYKRERTIRTEYNTLLGLLLKAPIDFAEPSLKQLQTLMERTDALLAELHACLNQPMFAALMGAMKRRGAGLEVDEDSIFTRGDVLREPIFYGAESAYSFQYRDFALAKYSNDDNWLRVNKGFGIQEAHAVTLAASRLPGTKIAALLQTNREHRQQHLNILSGYTLTVAEVAAVAGVSPETAKAVLEAFAAPNGSCNADFASLGDFNLATSQPLIRLENGSYILLQAYGIVEALYDSPFYWMMGDDKYRNQVSVNRGAFTEQFVASRLAAVFGAANVHRGVAVKRGSNDVTDIDVLVTFGDRALVVQCKSKRLTLEARKGNDLQLREDFKKAIGQAHDQALVSAKALSDPATSLTLSDGVKLDTVRLRAVYPICAVSDHYPALAVQARHFLRNVSDPIIKPSFVTDVFLIDVLAEMLDSPLKLLSYLDRRVTLSDRLASISEISMLGYHLANNLWLDADVSLAMIDDSCAIDLDTAMTVRREGLPGRQTPKGFLERFGQSWTGRLLTTIENSDDASLVGFGFFLLTLDEKSLRDLDSRVGALTAQCRKDGRLHDFAIVFADSQPGLTVHCNPAPMPDALDTLSGHCKRRKYVHRADRWFGLLVQPDDGAIKASLDLDFAWVPDQILDAETAGMARPSQPRSRGRPLASVRKLGRNDLCSCGSGLKYKKCCLEP